MTTIGSKLIKLDYMKGFVVCYSTAISLAIGSLKGVPLSTTNCVVGAILGIWVSGKTSYVWRVYNLPLNPKLEEEVGVENDVDLIFADEQQPIESLKINF